MTLEVACLLGAAVGFVVGVGLYGAYVQPKIDRLEKLVRVYQWWLR